MEADGVVAEVIFPNTIPPFFPKVSLVHQPPGAGDGDLERRWAGLRAHNRWLADFCAATPGPPRPASARSCSTTSRDPSPRSAGLAEHGLTGGVLLPGAPPGSGVPPLYAPDYEPIWRGVRGASASRSTTTAAARLPTWATTRPHRRCSCSR